MRKQVTHLGATFELDLAEGFAYYAPDSQGGFTGYAVEDYCRANCLVADLWTEEPWSINRETDEIVYRCPVAVSQTAPTLREFRAAVPWEDIGDHASEESDHCVDVAQGEGT